MPVLSDYFGLTRVINLPERTDRLLEITEQMEALGLQFAPGEVELYSACRPTSLAGFSSLGAHGCFMSHLEVLRNARQRDVPSVLVMEDDCEVRPRNLQAIVDAAKELQSRPWDIAYFGHIVPADANLVGRLVLYDGPLQTTHCYAVHERVLARLVAYLEACLRRAPGDPVGGPMPVDGALTMFRAANPDVKTWIAQPVMAGQRSSRSSITYSPFEVVPGIKQAMSLARSIRRTVMPRR